MGQAKTPAFLIIRSPVRDIIGTVGQRLQMASQLRQRQAAPDRDAIVDDVKIRLLEIDNLVAAGVFNPGVANVPLLGDCPIKHFGAAGRFSAREGTPLADAAQSWTEAVPW